ncbi:hypothetical protein [Stakelama tenebrarum]|uniref:Uncharacterized protein n=1 Tax=Stakelama tenebrarum TaxID=2711215 RepID=A0A6G6Y5L1_9SPHN|nr:hypothetical protein [Sphingosinithalassobacter tenebrarum]QIG80087.1 hypothetical protein G5C33_10045 [Sphingosinithalassobacter tenebrarum]
MLMIVGVLAGAAAFFLETSVSTYAPSSSLYGMPSVGAVNNIGLMQRQMMLFVAGAVMCLAGAIFTAAGALLDHLRGVDSFTPGEDGEERQVGLKLGVIIAIGIAVIIATQMLS